MDFLASNGLFVGLHTSVVLYPVDNETGFPNTYLLDSGAILLLNNSGTTDGYNWGTYTSVKKVACLNEPKISVDI